MPSNVQFDEDQVGMPKSSPGRGQPMSFAASNFAQSAPPSGMSAWLIRHGIMRSDSGAKVMLGAIVCINFIAAGLILYFFVLH
jgi:hypothetical protein